MAQTMVTICIDPRNQKDQKYYKALMAFIEEKVIKDYYLFSDSGASLQYIKPFYHQVLIDRLEIVGDIENHILIDHLTCKAFYKEYGVLDVAEECVKHEETMKAAKQWHEKYAPNVKLELFLQKDDNPEIIVPIEFES